MLNMRFDPHETLVTKRLKLEPLRLEHASLLMMPLRASRLYRYLSESPPISVFELKRQFQLWADRPDRGLCYVTRTAPDDFVIGMIRASFVGDGRALIMCKTFSQFVGHRYSREAVLALTKLLIRTGLVVEAHVDTRNKPARELFECLGFFPHSVIECADYIRGEPSDELRYVFPN